MLTLSRKNSNRNNSQSISLSSIYLSSPCELATVNKATINALKTFIKLEFNLLALDCNVIATLDESIVPSTYDDIVKAVNGRLLHVSANNNDSKLFGKLYNLMFRAVHDMHHVVSNSDFSLSGETRAFYYACERLNAYNDNHLGLRGDYNTHQATRRTIKSILYSEIVLQASVFHDTGSFAAQKLVLLSV